MNILSRNILMLLFAALTLIGCGGGDGGGGGVTNITGKFVDATVVGMGYKCGTSTTLGTTNAAGEFTCPAGQTVAFYVGDILIGSVASATAVVTPLDLVGANATPTHATVMNIVRFLMSISSTVPSPTGTLTIDPAVVALAAGKTIDFATATTALLETLITTIKPGATVYTNTQATTHVTSSINGLFAGNYSGTYSGTDSGNWSLAIAADGKVTGTSDAGAITGSMATTLSTGSTYAFTGGAGGTSWEGTLNVSTKVFSGTWGVAPTNGTFTGTASTTTGGGTTPAITSFTPTIGAVGATVTITGTNLSTVTEVLFTGPSPSTVPVNGVIGTKTATSITTTVPASLAAGSYTVSVVHPGGEVAATSVLTVTAAGGTGAGLTVSPAFNGLPTFADSVPTAQLIPSIGAAQFQYRQTSSNPVVAADGSKDFLDVTHTTTATATTVIIQLNVGIPITIGGNPAISFGILQASRCTLTGTSTGAAPQCSGIAFDKVAGTLTLTNASFIHAASGVTHTVSGALSFTPF